MEEIAPKTGGMLASVVLQAWPAILSLFLITAFSIAIAAVILDVSREDQEAEPPAGCRRLGLPPGKSHLRDQYNQKYAKGSEKDKSSWKVKALSIYPVKSCYPVELEHGEVIPAGMKYDRQFTFAQLISSVAKDGSWEITHQWSFLTQRQSPHLTNITTELWVPDPSSPTYSSNAEWVKSEGCIVISFPYMEDKLWISDRLERLGALIRSVFTQNHLDYDGPRISFRVPFNPPSDRIKEKAYPREPMKIWNECPEALNMGIEIPEEILAKLKYTLGISNQLTLFRVDPQRFREVYRCAPRKGQDVEYQPVVGMADAYPLHIINLASARDVASRLPKSTVLDAIRFRANIYPAITGKRRADYP
ncbi:hypothetical protein SLS58_002190 [Diplodia intermedia]|uniref:MOSC domain-containing protein n=1 Tax=Diplodia intermedia TaxID=856260 RepID=A0ABR3U0M2_9PEZI